MIGVATVEIQSMLTAQNLIFQGGGEGGSAHFLATSSLLLILCGVFTSFCNLCSIFNKETYFWHFSVICNFCSTSENT